LSPAWKIPEGCVSQHLPSELDGTEGTSCPLGWCVFFFLPFVTKAQVDGGGGAKVNSCCSSQSNCLTIFSKLLLLDMVAVSLLTCSSKA
jgi:hypothetical protein